MQSGTLCPKMYVVNKARTGGLMWNRCFRVALILAVCLASSPFIAAQQQPQSTQAPPQVQTAHQDTRELIHQGEMQKAQGNLAEAMKSFQAALQLAENASDQL